MSAVYVHYTAPSAAARFAAASFAAAPFAAASPVAAARAAANEQSAALTGPHSKRKAPARQPEWLAR